MGEEVERDEEEKAWEEVLRRMLPPGAPLPDEDHLDYSIAVQYEGPPVTYSIPTVDPVDVDSLSVRTLSPAPSDSPHTPAAAAVVDPVLPKLPPRFARIRTSATPSARSSFASRSDAPPPPADGSPSETQTCPDLESSPAQPEEGRRPMVVTFINDDGDDQDDGEEEEEGFSSPGGHSPPEVFPRRDVNPHVCSRCGRRNRLREKEACFVCDARYCSNCVLKAMGSMPEGRKCVSCIGRPIDESKRSKLGKCSRLLSRLCSHLEVRQIMKAEKECPANQLRPEQLVVNGRPLRQEELVEIMGCPLPPLKLRPGRYWYDKDSGLWGKVIDCSCSLSCI